MARGKETAAPSISNDEIIAEINLIEQIQQIESRLAYDPRSIRFAQLADAYLGIGNFDTAIALCEQGLEHHPNYDTATLVLAKAYYLSGNKPRAKQVLNDFLQTHPSSLPAHKILGDLALDEDDVIGTVNHYRVALRFDPINRNIIQTLVDLKDQYQKLKENRSDEEEEESAPVLKAKTPAKTVVPKATTKTPRPESPVSDEAADAKVTDDLLLKEEEEFKSSLEEKKPVKKAPIVEPVETPDSEKTETKAQTVEPAKAGAPHAAALVDAAGIMYFYDDDEVSFDEYKQRLQMQKEGKAVIMDRAELDALIAKQAKPAAPKAPAKDDVPAPAAKTALPPEAQEFERADDAEPEEVLSPEEQEAALDEVELSYKDYLDILTDEDELLEAIFTDEEEVEEEEVPEAKPAATLAERLTGFAAASDEEEPVSYLDYLQDLTDEADVDEATLTDGEPISLDQFSEYLDRSEEEIDFATYELLASRNGEATDVSEEETSDFLAEEGPDVSYRDYVTELSSSDERAEAGAPAIREPAAEVIEAEQPAPETKPELVAEEVIEQKTETIESKQVEIVEEPAAFEEEPVVEPEKETEIEEFSVVETIAPEPVVPQPAETPQPVLAAAEGPAEEEEEFEDYTEEEINPQDASPELVEKFASRGMYGSAYKVCKMLKVKNPTDAKIDRKILELKRLYLWSSQVVG